MNMQGLDVLLWASGPPAAWIAYHLARGWIREAEEETARRQWAEKTDKRRECIK